MKESGIVLFELKNRIRDYAWGSQDGLKLYCGIDTPSDRPAAECWMGAHAEAPSNLVTAEGGNLSLLELISLQPEKILGARAMHKSSELPFLFKALSASSPLSIQVHPDKKTAIKGFEREESLGIPRDSPLRTYRDPNHKPELALALSPFKALCGLRSIEEAAELLGPTLISLLKMRKTRDAAAYPAFLSRLLGLDAEEKKVICREAGARALLLSKSGEDQARETGLTTLRLLGLYPGDPGALAPLFMRLLLLQPGQALYISPGLLHSYLEGTILEVMASSDNVVRGGLSPKHIEKEELLRVVDPDAQPVLLENKPSSKVPDITLSGMATNFETWPCPAEEFALERICPDSGARFARDVDGPEILFCTEGSIIISAFEAGHMESPGSAARKELHIGRGGSAFLGASCSRYEITGFGTVYRVRYPGPGGTRIETGGVGRSGGSSDRKTADFPGSRQL